MNVAIIFTRTSLNIDVNELFNKSKRKAMKNVFETYEKRFDAFKEKVEEAGLKIKAKYNNEAVVLKKQSHNLKKKLDEYEDDGLSRWKKFKTDIKHDGRGVGKTMQNLFKHR